MTGDLELKSRLTVGNPTYAYNASIGVASSPIVRNKNNIGVVGSVSANPDFSADRNYGVFGVVDAMNRTHGRNYGISGMIGPLGVGLHYGGAGVFGANSTYYYNNPINIQEAYAGYFVGPVNVTSNMTATSLFTTTADASLSENIVPLSERDRSGRETLENILNMNVVEYNLKSRLVDERPEGLGTEKAEEVRKSYEVLKKEEDVQSSKRHYGIVAEELQKVYPDLVLEGQDGYLSVNYSELVPLLIRSIQVLKKELDEIKEGKNKPIAQTRENTTPAIGNANILYQNTPNPFKESTIIRFQLADDAQDAAICIYDISGKTVKNISVSSGMDNVSVNGSELGEGLFFYSLRVNGKETDVKRMVFSK
jgi:hypothetical protein